MMVESWLPIAAAVVAAYIVTRGDFSRRRLPANPAAVVVATAIVGVGVAKLFQFLGFGMRAPFDLVSDTPVFTWFPGLVAGVAAALLLAHYYKIPRLIMLDIAATATAMAYAVERLTWFLVRASLRPVEVVPFPRFATAAVYEFAAALLIFWFLWLEGRRAMQWQRPNGIVISEFLILMGALLFVMESVRQPWPRRLGFLDASQTAAVLTAGAGIVLIGFVLSRYFSVSEERRIVEHIALWGEATQPEYTPPTPECPHPERWKMYDTMTAEVEVLQFLKALVVAMKPSLIVETGTFTAVSTIAMAEGLQQNGFGKIITCELDPTVFAKARERIEKSGVADFVECRNEPSLEMKIDGTIDILFCDSDHAAREREVRRFLPQLNPHGLVLMHDASTHYKIVREGALRLHEEGLMSLVMLPTPRGLVIAQPSRTATSEAPLG